MIKRELELSESGDEILRWDVPVCCVRNNVTVTLYKGNISSLQLNEDMVGIMVDNMKVPS